MASTFPDLIAQAQTTEEEFLRHIFVRDQMAEWSKAPLIMARADGVHYWDVAGKRYLDALSGIYVASVGHNNRRVIEAVRVPPSAWITSQSIQMVRSPRRVRSVTARRLRPMRRWISWVRPLCRPLLTSRGVRVRVARGSMEYSLEIHPLPELRMKAGTVSSIDAVQITRVLPTSISTEPSAVVMKSGVKVMGRSWSGARLSER